MMEMRLCSGTPILSFALKDEKEGESDDGKG
jgi:hypothetical protein